MRHCIKCGNEIPPARILALPDEQLCKECVLAEGDVERTKGVMLWHHKTAPELYTQNQLAVATILRYSRRGAHAQLPLRGRLNEEKRDQADQELRNLSLCIKEGPADTFERTDGLLARCHPERPRATGYAGGLCLECATTWYAKRARSAQKGLK